jgi:hypothetical protein
VFLELLIFETISFIGTSYSLCILNEIDLGDIFNKLNGS